MAEIPIPPTPPPALSAGFSKPVTEMTEHEIVEEIRRLRERRAQKRDAAAAARQKVPTGRKAKEKQPSDEAEDAILKAALGDLLE